MVVIILTHRRVRSPLGAVVEVVEVGVLALPGEGGGAHHGRGDEEAIAEGRQDLLQGTFEGNNSSKVAWLQWKITQPLANFISHLLLDLFRSLPVLARPVGVLVLQRQEDLPQVRRVVVPHKGLHGDLYI